LQKSLSELILAKNWNVLSVSLNGAEKPPEFRIPGVQIVLVGLTRPEGLRKLRRLPYLQSGDVPCLLVTTERGAVPCDDPLLRGFSAQLDLEILRQDLDQILHLVQHGYRISYAPEPVPLQAMPPTMRGLSEGGARHEGQPGSAEQRRQITLTRREREIAEGLTLGFSNKEIARRHEISTNTVDVHMSSIFKKLGVRNRTQAALSLREAHIMGKENSELRGRVLSH
jgi:DNA-binding NarL/FixJ family response regulator